MVPAWPRSRTAPLPAHRPGHDPRRPRGPVARAGRPTSSVRNAASGHDRSPGRAVAEVRPGPSSGPKNLGRLGAPSAAHGRTDLRVRVARVTAGRRPGARGAADFGPRVASGRPRHNSLFRPRAVNAPCPAGAQRLDRIPTSPGQPVAQREVGLLAGLWQPPQRRRRGGPRPGAPGRVGSARRQFPSAPGRSTCAWRHRPESAAFSGCACVSRGRGWPIRPRATGQQRGDRSAMADGRHHGHRPPGPGRLWVADRSAVAGHLVADRLPLLELGA
ncbi:hypothetical protein SANTM175S_09031 [Streptomyces antimycoticus]